VSFARYSGSISLSNNRIAQSDARRQQDAAVEILRRFDRQPGVVLADEVGMGKTFVALAAAASVALERPDDGPVVVMCPPSLKHKWPKDWEVFRQLCLKGDKAKSLRAATAESGAAFLGLVDDPAERRNHIIFLTHGALHRALKDGFIKLAVIKRALRGRSSLSAQREAFPKFAARILRMEGVVGRHRDLLEELLNRPYDQWLRVIRRSDAKVAQTIMDDPIPEHLANALESLDGGDLTELVDALRALPLRESANVDERLQEARRALSKAMESVWKLALRRAHFSSPLLILDEAHHVKNPETKLASLFVDDEAAEESEIFETGGSLGGKFSRMLFLTATPFQLGHAELVRVLERFEGINWRGSNPPSLSRAEFRAELSELASLLDDGQASALRLDRAWGQLSSSHLQDEAGNALQIDEWWCAMEGRNDESVVGSVVEQVRATQQAMKAAERVLEHWVLRHLKDDELPGAPGIPRRTRLPGAAISDGNADSGLEIDSGTLLPFLLAGRAQGLFARATRGRALFAEGLASSFEAYLETRRGDVGIDEDIPPDAADHIPELEWYLRHLDAALPRGSAELRAAHPKIRATAEKAVQLWTQGEKVLIFCHYRATGRALRQHISSLLHDRILTLGSQRLTDVPKARVADKLEEIADDFFRPESDVRQAVTESLQAIVARHEKLDSRHHERVVELIRRFIRTPSFLVRYFPLDNYENGADGFAKGLDERQSDGVSLRERIDEFCRFLAERCIDEERDEYLQALERIQTGTHFGRDVQDTFDSDEGGRDEGTVLLPNVRLANGEVRSETRRRLLLTFNTPLFPEILIASSVMAEGVDLHLSCRYVIHHDLCWNPSTLEQRSGRVDRIGSRAERVRASIHLYLPYVAATQDEKMYRVVRDRERWFQIVMGDKYEVDEAATDKRAERIPLPASVQERLMFKLHP
jgi:superfamily II DNA or RNA helicase